MLYYSNHTDTPTQTSSILNPIVVSQAGIYSNNVEHISTTFVVANSLGDAMV